jgi:TPR repeat protein
LYNGGLGLPKDYQRAAALFRKACLGGNGDGCGDLGESYWLGNGVDKNPEEAKQLLSQGCSMGSNAACKKQKELQ